MIFEFPLVQLRPLAVRSEEGGAAQLAILIGRNAKKDGNKGKIISQEGINRDGLGPGMDK